MKQIAVSGKLLLVDLEGVCRLSVRFSKYSEQNVPFNALLLQRRLQNTTTRKIMPHPVVHAPKLLLVLRLHHPLGGHGFVSSLVPDALHMSGIVLCCNNMKSSSLHYRLPVSVCFLSTLFKGNLTTLCFISLPISGKYTR